MGALLTNSLSLFSTLLSVKHLDFHCAVFHEGRQEIRVSAGLRGSAVSPARNQVRENEHELSFMTLLGFLSGYY